MFSRGYKSPIEISCVIENHNDFDTLPYSDDTNKEGITITNVLIASIKLRRQQKEAFYIFLYFTKGYTARRFCP